MNYDYTSRTWIEISKQALDNNIAQYKQIVGNKILAPVIKGNAYGHGIIEVGTLCQHNKNIDWVCTASLQEALFLRKNSISKKILVLSYIDSYFGGESYGEMAQQAVLQNISLVACDIQIIKELNSRAKELNKKINLHIKIDTGLSRLGIIVDHAIDFIKYAKNLQNINIEGIWTHFAESPSSDRSFTNLQIQRFSNLIKELKKINLNPPLIHACNSSGISTVNMEYDNFSRLGIGLYGYWASEYVKQMTKKINPHFILKPILTWKSRICNIKEVSAGSFVGYDRTYQLKNNAKLAVIPIGYYDGYDRRLSNKSHVIIQEQVAPIIGTVCMNVITAHVTHIKNIAIGDEVILMGNQEGVQVSEFSKLGNINPRELTTKINPEIPRIITK